MERLLILFFFLFIGGCNTAEITTAGSTGALSLSSIPNASTVENESKLISFSILQSSKNLCSSAYLSIISTNVSLIPPENSEFSGTNLNCTLKLTPELNVQGSSYISVMLKEASVQIGESFSLLVGPPLPLFQPESSFGVDSLYTIQKPSLDYIGGSSIDSTGNLLLTPNTYNPGGPNFADSFLQRVDTTLGALDPTFNTTGEKLIDFGGRADYAVKLHVEADGKIFSLYAAENGVGDYVLSIVRLLPDGSFDPSFGGGDGLVNLNVCGNFCSGFAVQKIGVKYYISATNYNSQEIILFRLEDDGDLDLTMPLRQFDPDPANHKIQSAELITDGTHLYSLNRTDIQYEPANMENYIICKFDLAGASVPEFGGTGCLVINGANTMRRAGGLLLMDEGNTNLILAGHKSDKPWITKLSAVTGATVTSFGASGDLLMSDVTQIMGLKLHPSLGLLVLSQLSDGGKKTYGVDVYSATSGTKPLKNKFKHRFVGDVHPTADYMVQQWSFKDETLFVTGLLADAPPTVVTQKLLIQE